MHIERIDTLDLVARDAVSSAIDAYNVSRTGRPEPAERVAVLVRDTDGMTLGGAWCVIYYDWMHVDLLHLPEMLRGKRIGTRVMRAAEREAARRGCRGVWLDTASFQAPGFYDKLGYSRIGSIVDYVPGHDRIWLLKQTVEDGPDDPGIDVAQAPADVHQSVILAGLIDYNESRSGPSMSRQFGLVVREGPESKVTGGLWGRMSRGWLFVELLVLPEHARGQGLGSELMSRAETMVREQGGRGVWLDTFSFQARPFYEKLGYQVFAEIPDYPAPHRRFLLSKRLP